MVLDRNQYYKDLKYLNRPLNRLIVVDSKLPRLSRCYDNSIVLNEFEGSPDDHTLAELLPLLECTP
jgi:import inner membrane translocase subunit TIM50